MRITDRERGNDLRVGSSSMWFGELGIVPDILSRLFLNIYAKHA